MDSARGGELCAAPWRIDLRPIDSLSGSQKDWPIISLEAHNRAAWLYFAGERAAVAFWKGGKPSSMVHVFPSLNRKVYNVRECPFLEL